MCGIYGITENNPNLIRKIINLCSHRGPDGSEIYNDERITLGHNLLAITSSPDEGIQPWLSNNGNVLVYNGEIFNYEDILLKYKKKYLPKTSCDTELLSWLLDNFSYQEVISNTIDSMHAFAYYNKKQNELVLSRDHVGIKPIFFAETKSGIIFSSEIKALVDQVKTSNIIDRLDLACTCMLGVNVLRQTVFKGIYKVLPGETIIYDLIKKKVKNSFRTLIKPNSNNKFDSDEFYFKTSKAINNSTLGLRKFGIFLSGGIDSSVMAYELNKSIKPLNTFTNIMDPNIIINNEDHNSDAIIANKFSKHENFNHQEVRITPEIISKYWDNTINTIEEPRYNWNLPMYYYTNKILSESNIVVTMAGDIGDEIFGGYPHYYRMMQMKNKPKTWSDFILVWMRKFAAPVNLNMKFNFNDLHQLLLTALPEELWNPDDLANSAMALDCITTVSEDFFSRNDRFGMKFSMEGRFPLASKEFMQYCLSINSKFKIGTDKTETKIPVKLSYKDKIPSYILSKQKTGWSVPITSWLKDSDVLKNKYIQTINTEDGIKEILSKNNYKDNEKRIIITWMLRTWAQQYKMSI